MKPETLGKKLRTKIQRLHSDRRRRRYSDGLRQEIVAFAESRRKAGANWQAIGEELDMPPATFRGWSPAKPGFVRVVTVPEPDPSLAIESPSGYRVVGLTLESVVMLLGRLGEC